MMEAKAWPADMVYRPCSSPNLDPVVRRDLDLRKAFANVKTILKQH